MKIEFLIKERLHIIGECRICAHWEQTTEDGFGKCHGQSQSSDLKKCLYDFGCTEFKGYDSREEKIK